MENLKTEQRFLLLFDWFEKESVFGDNDLCFGKGA